MFLPTIFELIGWMTKHLYPPFIVYHLKTFVMLQNIGTYIECDHVMILIVVTQLWMHPSTFDYKLSLMQTNWIFIVLWIIFYSNLLISNPKNCRNVYQICYYSENTLRWTKMGNWKSIPRVHILYFNPSEIGFQTKIFVEIHNSFFSSKFMPP